MKKITVLLMSILLLLSACGQAPIAAETETIPQVTQEQKEAPMIPAKAEAVDESTEAGDNAIAAKPAEQMDAPKGADKAVEKQPASAEAGRPAVSEAPAASKSEAKSDPAPTLHRCPNPNLLRHLNLRLCLRPSLTLRRLWPAGTSTQWRRRCRRATNTRKRSTV